jgi:8-oxo-dGTP pyrophosphatase MutT (NUDIX family)
MNLQTTSVDGATVASSAFHFLQAYRSQFPAEAPLLVRADTQLRLVNADVLSRSNMMGHVTTSMLVVDPDERKVLLIAHGIYLDWTPPGGHYEPGMSLWSSAAREVLEETGVITRPVDWHGIGSSERPVDIDTHPIPANSKKAEGDHVHHDFTFVGLASSLSPLIAQEEEVNGVKWVPFDELLHSPLERVRRLGDKLLLLQLH